ncbi:MAG: hypothetical protein JWN37_871 [Candidatus Nomurabacteria bacterium]|nr:hypothetical protein [Candidatus Nomurabacteria bacterium]
MSDLTLAIVILCSIIALSSSLFIPVFAYSYGQKKHDYRPQIPAALRNLKLLAVVATIVTVTTAGAAYLLYQYLLPQYQTIFWWFMGWYLLGFIGMILHMKSQFSIFSKHDPDILEIFGATFGALWGMIVLAAVSVKLWRNRKKHCTAS